MIHYIIRRVIVTLPVLLGVSILVFSMLHLTPGDPVTVMLAGSGEGGGANLDPEAIEELRQQLGLDRPIWEQYITWLGSVVTGDLGQSIWSKQPVLSMIADQVGPTVTLATASLGLAIVVGVVLGVVAALRPHSWLDTGTMALASLGISMPGFWLGLVLIFTFAFALGWFPSQGTGGIDRLILPAIALAANAAALIARMVRSSLLEVLREDYIITARAKGVREANVVWRHGLRNSLIPVVTIAGLQFGHLLSGAVVIEAVFSRQGIGRLLLRAIEGHDFPVVQGVVLFIAVVYVFVNLSVDVVYGILDPRIHYG